MDKGTGGYLLIALMTGCKMWMTLYGAFLLLYNTLFYSYIPVALVGSFAVFAMFYKLRVRPAEAETLAKFFGPSHVKERFLEGNRKNSQLGPKESQIPQGPLLVIGHRGAGLDAPENSLSAIRLCKDKGCEAVEFDVSVTKDLIPVVFHDDNIMRMTGIDRDLGDMTWQELSQVNISVLHPLGGQFRGERVPSLEETIDLCLMLKMKFFMDLKDDNETVKDFILAAFQKRGEEMYSLAVVSSFNLKAVYKIRRCDPKIIGCMAWRPGYLRYISWNPTLENLVLRYDNPFMDFGALIHDTANDWAMRNFYWWFVGLSVIFLHKDTITREEGFRWLKKGIKTFVCPLNTPLEQDHFIYNVQIGYLTDTLSRPSLS